MGQKLKPPAAAEYMTIKPGHLRQLHHINDGPPRIRIAARTYVYDTDDLDRWMEDRKVTERKAS